MTRTFDQDRPTLTDIARRLFKGVLDPVAAFLNRLGIPPNTVTLVGLFGHILAAYYAARGNMTAAGLFILFLGPVDALDGTMARLRGEPTKWGGFVDSVVDRYSELFIFGGMMYFFMSQANWLGVILSYLAASGSIMVSYVRARSQGVGVDIKKGWFSRLERYVVLVPSLVFNWPLFAVSVIAIGAQLTAVQRVFVMRQAVHKE